MTGYIIFTSPRSGSTLLCTLLRATGVAGWPESQFHGPSEAQWAKRLALPVDAPFRDIVTAVLEKGRGETDVFGLRQQWHSFPLLCDVLKAERSEQTSRGRLEGALGPLRYIYLEREDKIEQAVSLIRAEQTGIWHRNADGSIYERLATERDDGFDAQAIKAQAAEFATYDVGWTSWFEAQSITPLRLSYAELASSPAETLAQVLDWIGLYPSYAKGTTARTRKLADATSKAWCRRVRESWKDEPGLESMPKS